MIFAWAVIEPASITWQVYTYINMPGWQDPSRADSATKCLMPKAFRVASKAYSSVARHLGHEPHQKLLSEELSTSLSKYYPTRRCWAVRFNLVKAIGAFATRKKSLLGSSLLTYIWFSSFLETRAKIGGGAWNSTLGLITRSKHLWTSQLWISKRGRKQSPEMPRANNDFLHWATR